MTGPAAEAFRALRTHMRFALAARPGKTVIVTSALPEEGKTYVATNLALSAAASGEDVMLIDLDLRKPTAHRYLAVDGSPGLTDVLAGDASLADALIEIQLPEHAASQGRLTFLPAGHRIPNPGELVASEALAQAIRALAGGRATLLLLDTPPLLPVSDATAIAGLADSTLLVCRADAANRSTLVRFRELLTSGGHHAIGLVLTASWSRRRGYGAPYGEYGTPAAPDASVSRSPGQSDSALSHVRAERQTVRPHPQSPY